MRTTKSPVFTLDNSSQVLSNVKSDTDFPAYRQAIKLSGIPLAVVLFTNINWLTARASFSGRVAGRRRGADAYLTKLFQWEELQVVLINLLQSRRILQTHYSQLALQTSLSEPSPAIDRDSLEDQFLHKLRLALEPQLTHTNFSIEDVCHRMRMSRSTLHQKLVALTGMSITHYVRAFRLGKAKELLTSSNLNISEVAYAVGFDDPKYFSRVFSDEFGISPANFRLSAKG